MLRYISFLVIVSVLSFSVANATVTDADLSAARDSGRRCAARIIKMPLEKPTEVRHAFLDCLSRYVQLPTINPPGHEELGVAFLESVFKELNIPTWSFSAKGRPSLVATLTPSNAKLGPGRTEPYAWGRGTESASAPAAVTAAPSVLLLNHIDVVDVFPEQWADPKLTFSGAIGPYPGEENGQAYLWGRGALDMKGIGMLQLFSMALLKLDRADLKKNIHFLAVADEEQNATGAKTAQGLIARGGDLEALTEARVLLGEGGFGIKDAIGPGTYIHTIGAEEKGGAWLKVTHPSPASLFTALAKLKLAPRTSQWVGREFRAAGCRLEGARTPKAKVNVVPSKIELTVACTNAPSVSAFEKAFAAKGAKTVAIKAGNTVSLDVQTASSGHGSVGLSQSALEVAILGLQNIGAVTLRSYGKPDFYSYYQTDATKDLLETVGQYHNFSWVPHVSRLDWWITWLPFIEQRALGYLGTQLATERLFRTSCTWTGLEETRAGAEAMLDCRLMPPEAMGVIKIRREGTQFAALLKDYLKDDKLDLNIIEEWNFTASPINHPAVKIMREEIMRQNPKAHVTTFLFPGGTDNHSFREAAELTDRVSGVPSYGFFPVELTMELVGTQHGSNERYPVQQVLPSISIYSKVVRRLSQ